MTTAQDQARSTRAACTVEAVEKSGLLKPGFRAVCPTCLYASFRYDKQVTAELVATTHDQNCPDRALAARRAKERSRR